MRVYLGGLVVAEVRSIRPADLGRIENFLETIHNNINVLEGNLNDSIGAVSGELEALAQKFQQFVQIQVYANRSQLAETRLVKIRQELETKFGHYSAVRRTTIGILQADDLGIVKADTITGSAEELMLSAPNYWLAPCLVALSAWINDKPEPAQKALNEALKRDDEKTSLFFTLVCSRAGRKEACNKWLQRYLANQDEESMDSKCVVVLDAFVGGLLGIDSGGVVRRHTAEWLNNLAEKPGFAERQRKQWADAIYLKRKASAESDYPYLKKFSPTWQQLNDIMLGAELHKTMLDYLDSIFAQEVTSSSVKRQIDDILSSLVSDFDEEETPLRKNERLEQLVIDFGGEEQRAKANMNIEQTSFERRNNFSQILTDAAMNPKTARSSKSVQKFAVSLNRDMIIDAYKDVTADNRMKIPGEIDIVIDTFEGSTANGGNEEELVKNLNELLDEEKTSALEQCAFSAFDKARALAGGILFFIGLFMKSGSYFPLLWIVPLGIGAVMIFKASLMFYQLNSMRKNIVSKYEERRKSHRQILRATLAEVVDFRAEFMDKDSQSAKVIDFLRTISPEQYIKRPASGSRMINVVRQ